MVSGIVVCFVYDSNYSVCYAKCPLTLADTNVGQSTRDKLSCWDAPKKSRICIHDAMRPDGIINIEIVGFVDVQAYTILFVFPTTL